MRCVSGWELAIVEEVFFDYDLTDAEYRAALDLVEARAMDTSSPFKAYDAAHAAAASVVSGRT